MKAEKGDNHLASHVKTYRFPRELSAFNLISYARISVPMICLSSHRRSVDPFLAASKKLDTEPPLGYREPLADFESGPV